MIKKLNDREHILHRPNMYIGATDTTNISDFIIQDEKIKYQETQIVPGLIKIINEVIDNAVDVAIKTNFKYSNIIKVSISEDTVSVSDNGTGIPVKEIDGLYTPHLCWGHARAGSNFDESKGQIGANGVGSFATNVFSSKFTGITDDGSKNYKIVFTENASKFKESISSSKVQGTTVTFTPDLKRFGLTEITKNHIDFIYQRLINLSICYPDITFYFNKQKIKTKKFKDFVSLFGPDFEIYENKNIKIAVLPNEYDDFKFFSYVNGLKIPDGGIHIDTIMYNITNTLRDKLVKKYSSIKPGDIKNKLTIICFMTGFKDPKYSSQTKEKLTNSIKEFNDFAEIDYSFINKIYKNSKIIDPIIEIYKIKETYKAKQELKNAIKSKTKFDKYYPATKTQKYLFLTEGDSACGGLMSVLSRDNSGFFALQGKPLNAYDSSVKDLASNKELTALLRVIQDNDYEYIITATDSDLDGLHIISLLLGFIEKCLPEYKVKFGRLYTPVKAVIKNKLPVRWVYGISDSISAGNSESLKYYKGLGTWKADSLKKVIETDGLNNMIKIFNFDSTEVLDDFLNSNKADKRKDYIKNNTFNIAKL